MNESMNRFYQQQIGLFTFYKHQQQQFNNSTLHDTILHNHIKNTSKLNKIKIKQISSLQYHQQISHLPKSKQITASPKYYNLPKSVLKTSISPKIKKNHPQHTHSHNKEKVFQIHNFCKKLLDHPRYQRIITQPNSKIFKQSEQNQIKQIDKVNHNQHLMKHKNFYLFDRKKQDKCQIIPKKIVEQNQKDNNKSLQINRKEGEIQKKLKIAQLEEKLKLPVLNYTQKMLENKKIYHKRESSILYQKLSNYFNQKHNSKSKLQIIDDKRQKSISACLKKANHASLKNIFRQNCSNQKKKNQKVQQPTFFNLSHKIIQEDKLNWEDRKKAFLKKLGIRI